MNENLLSYYNQELAFIRRLGEEFAEAHPKIAGRLKLGAKAAEDPHVARLIEAFALLNARIRHKLDDDFTELTDGLFSVLYPHYQAPIPSMSILKFNHKKNSLQERHSIPRHTMIETKETHGEPCRFRTAYPVDLWPIELEKITLSGRPLQAPTIFNNSNITGSLRIDLQCTADGISFADLAPDNLRLFLNMQPQQAYQLYELLFNNTVNIVLASSHNDKNPIILPKNTIQPVGFSRDEGLLPYSSRSFIGYRLLTELFVFPEKFLFFNLIKLNKSHWNKFKDKAQLYFYFNRHDDKLEKQISINSFALGCTPIVNLFEEHAEPIRLNHTTYEYQVIPSANHPSQTREVYSIEQVTGTNRNGDIVDYVPFYGAKHHLPNPQYYWYASRKPAWQGKQYNLQGSEVFLTLLDLELNPLANEDWVIDVKLLCTNRDLPSQLPFGGNEPQLRLWEYPEDMIDSLQCITPFTSSYHPSSKENARWQFISHLSLNHLSLTDDECGIDALKEILKLYDFTHSDEVKNMIDGILNLKTKRITARHPYNTGNGFWQGTEITMEINEDKFSGVGLFLFAEVLERFLALYSTINSFTQFIVKTKHRGELYRWVPRAGEKTLL